MTTGNVLPGDGDSIAFASSPEQLLRFIYLTGNASKPGGFYPKGQNDIRPKELLHS